MNNRRPTAPDEARAGSRLLRLAGLFFFLTLASAPASLAQTGSAAGKWLFGGRAALGDVTKEPAISAIAARLEQQRDKARLIFEITAEVAPNAFPVVGPDRIVVDLPEVAFRLDLNIRHPAAQGGRHPRPGGALEADGLVKSYRFGLFAPGRSRIVIDLARPAKVTYAASDSKQQNARLVIELQQTDPASFASEAAKHAAASAQPQVAAAEPQAAGGDKPIVVIDPGHGGVDVGAAGAHGEQEKTIVFDFARTLKAKLEAGGRFQVVLTRTQDVFMALDERVRFARQNNASLFLSIHADTLGEASVEGATVYTVSARASDAEAAKIAEKENFADQAAGLEHKDEAGDVGDILFDLTRRETRTYSRLFAETLIGRWKTAGNLNKNPSRSAGFVVLKAHDIPSVLLELGYLSSERDLTRLTSVEWRERAAETTAEAIEAFFDLRAQHAQTPAQAVASTARSQ